MILKWRLLGVGPSTAVPTLAGFWGSCSPENIRNRRKRSSMLIQAGSLNILVDATPDVYFQLQREGIVNIDALILTHGHYDHIAGVGELFCMLRGQNRRIPLYTDTKTLHRVQSFFSYAFEKEASGGLIPNVIAYGGQDVLGLDVHFFPQDHGSVLSLGVRIGEVAYSIDAVRLEDKAFRALANVKTWFVPAKGFNDTDSHAGLTTALTWIEKVQPQMAYLVNLGLQLDYDEVTKMLPSNVTLGYDGLCVEGEL